MAETRRKSRANAIVWGILGLLILSLGGFGISNFGGTTRNVAELGGQEITVDDYARAFQAEQRRIDAQTGQSLTAQQMEAFGLDRTVLERLLSSAALDEEARRVGVSVGDAEVARQIRETPAFQGISGEFDREGYAQALRFSGLTERDYEAEIRADAARAILGAAVSEGVPAPEAQAALMSSWAAETRDVVVARVTMDDLAGGAPVPTDAELAAFFEENGARFETPETRAVTYAAAIPEEVAATVEIEEERLRDLYEERADEYRQPRRVLAERLAFANTEAAQEAMDRIASDEAAFDALVEERGLTLADVDQGELSEADLPGPAAEALFALEEPGVAGPVETDLGPAIYRVNAILDPTETPFEDVRDDLAAELTLDVARRRIDAIRDDVDDLLAGGATLEELAQETELTLGTLDWTEEGREGLSAYEEVREAVTEMQEGDFPELLELSDGGLVALRIDAVTAPEIPPLDTIRGEVTEAWTAEATARALSERAEALAEAPAADAAETPTLVEGLSRDARGTDLPPAVAEAAFAAEEGVIRAVAGDAEAAFVLRVQAVNDAPADDPEVSALTEALADQMRDQIAADILDAYGTALREAAGYSIDSQAVQAVRAQIGG